MSGITEKNKARMQAELDQNWATIEGVFNKDTSPSAFEKAIEVFDVDAEPYAPENIALLCISIVRMQTAFNTLVREALER